MKKIAGILVMTLLIATAVLPVVGTMNIKDNSNLFSTSLSEVEWSKTYGGEEADKLWRVRETDDGGYISSGTTAINDNRDKCPWVVKVDSEGNELWDWTISEFTVDNQNLEVRNSWCDDVLQMPDGGYIIAITVLITEFEDEYYEFGGVAKLDSDGNEEWIKIFGDGFDWTIRLEELLEFEDGYLGVGDYATPIDSDYDHMGCLFKINYDGDLIWHKEYNYGDFIEKFNGISITNDGGFLLIGSAGLAAENNYNGWIVKTNAQGEKEWDKDFGGNRNDGFWDGYQNSNGEYIAVGWTESFGFGGGYADVWLIRVDTGEIIENKTIGTTYYDATYGFDNTDDGGFILPPIIDFGGRPQYGWVYKFDDELNVEWHHMFDEERQQAFIGVCSTSDGGCIASGLSGSWDSVSSDALLVKYRAFDNERPDKPDTPSGPSKGDPETEYTFSTNVVTDPDGDTIMYKWDWGDGNFSELLGSTEASYTWSYEDNFEIRVMAVDEHGGESDWSEPFAFSTPKNKAINIQILNRLLTRFPILELLI